MSIIWVAYTLLLNPDTAQLTFFLERTPEELCAILPVNGLVRYAHNFLGCCGVIWL